MAYFIAIAFLFPTIALLQAIHNRKMTRHRGTYWNS